MNQFDRLSSLEGKTAVVVGAAGQIGFATTSRLVSLGLRVFCLVRRDSSNMQKLLMDLPKYNPDLHFVIEADVTKSETLKNAAKIVNEKTGECHILINAAGTTRSIPPNQLDLLSDQIFDEIVTTNLRGVFATVREFAPLLKKTGDGIVINISSTASLRAGKSNVAYASAKAGLNLMTQTLAKALAPEIRLLAIAPGYLVKATSGAEKSPEFNNKAAQECPLKRIGYAEDIVNTIESCLTSIRFSTGSLFVIDGGRTL